MVLGYHAVNLPLRLLLMALHFCRVPKTLVNSAEHFYAQCSRQASAATEPQKEA